MTKLFHVQKRTAVFAVFAALLLSVIQAPSFATPNSKISMEVPSYPGQSKLQVGVENSSVKKVQSALIELGYAVSSANGKYGPSTTKAISQFYKDLGDSDDGTSIGPIGWKRLFTALDEQRADEEAAQQTEASQPIVIDPAAAQVVADLASAVIDRSKKTKVVKLSRAKKKVVALYAGDITLAKDVKLYKSAREMIPFEVWRNSPFTRYISMKESHRNCKAIGRSGKYRGRWQMSPQFWKTYGGKAFASKPDKASCQDQDLVAYRGWLVRGWAPWAY